MTERILFHLAIYSFLFHAEETAVTRLSVHNTPPGDGCDNRSYVLAIISLSRLLPLLLPLVSHASDRHVYYVWDHSLSLLPHRFLSSCASCQPSEIPEIWLLAQEREERKRERETEAEGMSDTRCRGKTTPHFYCLCFRRHRKRYLIPLILLLFYTYSNTLTSVHGTETERLVFFSSFCTHNEIPRSGM